MAGNVKVKIKLRPICRLTYELSTVMKGRFFKRMYVGYTKQEAVKEFQIWLGKQLN